MAMLRERHIGQLRENTSVPHPVLVVLSIQRGGPMSLSGNIRPGIALSIPSMAILCFAA
jgi:hypothetical protein